MAKSTTSTLAIGGWAKENIERKIGGWLKENISKPSDGLFHGNQYRGISTDSTYLKDVGLSRDDSSRAQMIAELRIGEMSMELPTAQGARTDLTSGQDVPKFELLSDAGINKKTASHYEQIAGLPEEKFENPISMIRRQALCWQGNGCKREVALSSSLTVPIKQASTRRDMKVALQSMIVIVVLPSFSRRMARA